jgi:hypothetical protein
VDPDLVVMMAVRQQVHERVGDRVPPDPTEKHEGQREHDGG